MDHFRYIARSVLRGEHHWSGCGGWRAPKESLGAISSGRRGWACSVACVWPLEPRPQASRATPGLLGQGFVPGRSGRLSTASAAFGAALSARDVSNRIAPAGTVLRSFGDDNVRLRSATLGRRSLMERLSRNRFDLFEEVLVRHLSVIGPVVGPSAPLGSRCPLWGRPGSDAVGGPMAVGRGEFVARCARRDWCSAWISPSPGLVWEIQRVNDRGNVGDRR